MFNVGRVLVLNNPQCSYRRGQEWEEDIQGRSSACSQQC